MISLSHATKRYGTHAALNDLTLTIDAPGIYCLLGRNGAGKTTLLKTIAGHHGLTSGKVTVDGMNVGPLSMPEQVHFVATDASQFNTSLTRLFAAAALVNPEFDQAFALEVAGRFNLDVTKRYRSLSFGMKAMANTIIALCSGRSVILLDEPVLGFDPVMRARFYDLLLELVAQKPRIVLVSTHIIDEISAAAEQIIIIDQGQLVLFTDINTIDEQAYTVTGPGDQVIEATRGLNVIAEKVMGGYMSRSIFDRRLEATGSLSVSSLSLQDFFVALATSSTSHQP